MGKINLLTASMRDVAQALQTGQTTSEALVLEYLERIEANNVDGYGLKAVFETATEEKLLKVAKDLDEQRRNNRVKSELHGVPILIKDTINTAPELGMQTTGGTIALRALALYLKAVDAKLNRGSTVPGNAEVVDNLLKAGVIILGKTSCTVLNNFYATETPIGWSPRFPPALNPYALGKNTGGSSTGSAVGLAAGFCAGSVGQETNNSIVGPAGRAGLYGLKPTASLTSTKGCIPGSIRQDCIGPMGKTVWDVAALLTLLAKTDRDYTQYTIDRAQIIGGYRLGIPRCDFEPSGTTKELAELDEKYAADLHKIKEAVVADPLELPDVKQLWTKRELHGDNGEIWTGTWEDQVLMTEQYSAMNEYLAGLENTEIRSLEDLVKWNDEHPDKAFPDIHEKDQGWLKRVVRLHGEKGQQYSESRNHIKRIGQEVEDVLTQHNIDALVFQSRGYQSSIAAAAGLPYATVPTGTLKSGETIGLYLIAPMGREDLLIGLMSACEAIFPPRPVPKLLGLDKRIVQKLTAAESDAYNPI